MPSSVAIGLRSGWPARATERSAAKSLNGFRVYNYDLGFVVWGFLIRGLGFWVEGLGSMIGGFGFRVWD